MGHLLKKNDTALSGDSFIAQLKENVEIIENIPKEQIERIVKQISKSRRVVILGFEKNQIQALELQKKNTSGREILWMQYKHF